LSCKPSVTNRDICNFVLGNGRTYSIDGENKIRSYKLANETEIICYDMVPINSNLGLEDSLVVLFKRSIDNSQFAREGRIVDNGLDEKLELCDPEDECKNTMKK